MNVNSFFTTDQPDNKLKFMDFEEFLDEKLKREIKLAEQEPIFSPEQTNKSNSVVKQSSNVGGKFYYGCRAKTCNIPKQSSSVNRNYSKPRDQEQKVDRNNLNVDHLAFIDFSELETEIKLAAQEGIFSPNLAENRPKLAFNSHGKFNTRSNQKIISRRDQGKTPTVKTGVDRNFNVDNLAFIDFSELENEIKLAEQESIFSPKHSHNAYDISKGLSNTRGKLPFSTGTKISKTDVLKSRISNYNMKSKITNSIKPKARFTKPNINSIKSKVNSNKPQINSTKSKINTTKPKICPGNGANGKTNADIAINPFMDMIDMKELEEAAKEKIFDEVPEQTCHVRKRLIFNTTPKVPSRSVPNSKPKNYFKELTPKIGEKKEITSKKKLELSSPNSYTTPFKLSPDSPLMLIDTPSSSSSSSTEEFLKLEKELQTPKHVNIPKSVSKTGQDDLRKTILKKTVCFNVADKENVGEAINLYNNLRAHTNILETPFKPVNSTRSELSNRIMNQCLLLESDKKAK